MTEFNFNDWLSGVNPPTETVTIYEKPHLVQQIRDLNEDLEALRKRERPSERAMGDPDPISVAEAALNSLMDELSASKATFYLSEVPPEDEQAIWAAHPDPDSSLSFDVKPPRLGANATEAQSQAYLKAWAVWEMQREAWEEENSTALTAHNLAVTEAATLRGAERLARAITYIQPAGGERQRVTLTADNLRALQSKIGQPQVGLLVEALNRVSSTVPEDPDPFS